MCLKGQGITSVNVNPLADFPSDPGCDSVVDPDEHSVALQCDDGVDNDGDLLTDFPDDPDCFGPTDGSESPGGPANTNPIASPSNRLAVNADDPAR